ncbi:MAG TPA: ComEA family DNA-binding protein [Kofleriaceae bacterium]|nr:ComEA family DNA-binding protein [Kofleriaceae bacterium]
MPIIPPSFSWRRGARQVVVVLSFVALIATVTATWLEPARAQTPPVPVVTQALATTAARDCAAVPGSPPRAARKPPSRASARIDLNTATVADLVALPGIGPVKAERIVAWRKRHGRFRRVIDLRRVKGFGKKTVRRLRPYLTVTPKSTTKKNE